MVKLSGEGVEVAEGGEGGGDGERLDGESGNVLHGGHHLVGEVGLHAVDPGHAQTVVQAVDQAKDVVKAVDKDIAKEHGHGAGAADDGHQRNDDELHGCGW